MSFSFKTRRNPPVNLCPVYNPRVKELRMKHPINWIEVATPNPQASRDFFSKLFGWTYEPSPAMPDYFIFEAGEGPMGAMHGYMHEGPQMRFYVYTPDIDAKLAEVEAAGGKVISPKLFINDAIGNIAHVADPNGNVFGLWDRKRYSAK
jgi:predicted enzyme related to lactoylglutathione lyase